MENKIMIDKHYLSGTSVHQSICINEFVFYFE
jgi:hypothetical protein